MMAVRNFIGSERCQNCLEAGAMVSFGATFIALLYAAHTTPRIITITTIGSKIIIAGSTAPVYVPILFAITVICFIALMGHSAYRMNHRNVPVRPSFIT